MKYSIKLAIAAVSLSMIGASESNAAALHFTFSPGSYYDYYNPLVHTPVTGSFDFDNVTGILSSVNYTSVSGTFTTGAEYNAGDASQIYFGPFGSSSYDVYQLAGSLIGGGTVAINSGTHPWIPITAGGSLTTNVAGGVPEPATWAMMLIGFGGLGSVLRRRRVSFAT